MSGDTGLVPGLTRVCLFQIPRYIITLHELLAHTPHDHVERESLEYAKSKLEELSRVSAAQPLPGVPVSLPACNNYNNNNGYLERLTPSTGPCRTALPMDLKECACGHLGLT